MATVLPPSDSPAAARRRLQRRIKDLLAKYFIGIGGIAVIAAILLIFFYLAYVVYPLFIPGEIESRGHYPAPGSNPQSATLALGLDEQNEIGFRDTQSGNVIFFEAVTGKLILEQALPIPANTTITSYAASSPDSQVTGYALSDGRVIVTKRAFSTSYADNTRTVTPAMEFPLGDTPIQIAPHGTFIKTLAVAEGDENSVIAAATDNNQLIVYFITRETSFLDESTTIKATSHTFENQPAPITHLRITKDLKSLYSADANGQISSFNISNPDSPELINRVSVTSQGSSITSLRFLTGDISLLVGDSNGWITQWFPVRDSNNIHNLTKIRLFKVGNNSVDAIAPEHSRKGFIGGDSNGDIGIFHATANRTILQEKISDAPIRYLAVSPHANGMLAEDANNQVYFYHVHNEHPEVSWSSLWNKVWYENYDKPDYIWQSSSASNDFEPKFSLVPIAFGTLKAAFYAMLFAIPLALMGAIYTAYFMTPKLRGTIKPTIEIMEALPTVILGFMAGLWLAPLLENYLPGVFTLLILLPVTILVFSFSWHQLPRNIRATVPDGWQPALLIPVILLAGWLAFAMSHTIEGWFFGGDMRAWLDTEFGMKFDQRNALVVGIAMGFAVVPVIFSIAEDAIFSVPKHLTNGSLALGATSWQTLTRVVLLTASPGIFSAVMIGFGRAVGETMIVLMATGNTPVMDLSIFQGLRTLSANIAVEMPESEVNSTHYRVLFLTALVLLIFTFIFNTIAEIVRQRLRKKYSSL
ncbi:MAG: ABC transporter permease subunit [Gammaproteobacteria bacterium]|nr:ABC transporter permease subunit [Gammaproteobacteria bacterium]